MRSNVLFSLLAVSAIACASCGSGGGGSGGGSGSGGGTGSGGSGAVTCDAFTNVGQVVTPTSNPAPTPAMTGGTLVDGTYALTSWVEYNGDSASSTHKETFVFASGTMKHVGSENGGADTILAGTYATSATSLTLGVECPVNMSLTVSYTATPTTFTFVAPDNPNQVQEYTKQ